MNVTVRNELHHRIRSMLVDNFIKNNNGMFRPELVSALANASKDKKDKAKFLVRRGYGNLVAQALGEKGREIGRLVDKATAACVYRSGATFLAEQKSSSDEKPSDLNWSQVRELMSEYALDSSDAMILNMGLKDKKIRGLITADSDFRYVRTNTFEIITKDIYLSDEVYPCDLEWRL
ncbi:MAG: hypothetical protein AB7G93_10060 [Bdellovibrionales bacterium]